MAFDDRWVTLIPPSPPPSALGAFAGRVDAATSRFEEVGNNRLTDGYVWSLVLAADTALQVDVESRLPFVDRMMFGFLDPAIDFQEGPGLIVEVDLTRRGESAAVDIPRRLESVVAMADTEWRQQSRLLFGSSAPSHKARDSCCR